MRAGVLSAMDSTLSAREEPSVTGQTWIPWPLPNKPSTPIRIR